MTDREVVAARSIFVGVIGLALTLPIFVLTVLVTHDEPLIIPSLVLAVSFAAIVILGVIDLRGMS